MKHLNEDYSYINEISMKEENEAIEAFRLREAKDKGVKEGIEQGTEFTKIETAKNMLKETDDFSFISRVTGLSVNKIEELKN